MEKNNRMKFISASAVALIAFTGTAYATGNGFDSGNKEEAQQQVVETVEVESAELETANAGEELDEELEQAEDEDEAETEEAELVVEEDVVTEEESTEEDDSEATDDSEQETEEEPEQDEGSEVNAELVVPLDELPINEETGILDFATYHEIANGRALPRPLTEEEEAYFQEYVVDGVWEDVRVSVTQTEQEFVYVYPEEFYTESYLIDYDKFTEIRSELLTLEEQAPYIEERGDMGEFLEELDNADTSHSLGEGFGFDDLKDDEFYGSDEHLVGDVFEQNLHYEVKDVLDNLSLYDAMTPEEFKEAYGFNFLFRAEVEEGGLYQQEHEIGNGYTLVIEAESLKTGEEDSTDSIVLTWGIVEEVVKFTAENAVVYKEGQYNLVTSPMSPDFVESKIEGSQGNTIAVGHATLREDGVSTPERVTVDYNIDQVPQVYSIVADAVHVGAEQPLHSELVGYIEYGWEIGSTRHEYENVGEGEGGDVAEPRPEDNIGTGGETGQQDPQGDTDVEGEEYQDGTPEPTETIIEEDINEGNVNETDLESGLTPESEDEGSTEGEETEETETGTSSGEQYQQTGTSILWGSILSGLGLGGLGTYLFKKSKKDEEGDDVDG